MMFKSIILPFDETILNNVIQNHTQIFLFFISILAGCVLGSLFDIFYGASKNNKIIKHIFLTIFFLIYIVYLRFFCYIFSGEVYRAYFTVANLSGFALWEITVGVYVRKMVEKMVCLLYGFYKKIVGYAKNNRKIRK